VTTAHKPYASRARAGANESGDVARFGSSTRRRARLSESGDVARFESSTRERAGVSDFDARHPIQQRKRRVRCGARRRVDGGACRAPVVPGRKRCRWHGGCSTGPVTLAGLLAAYSRLRGVRELPEPERLRRAEARLAVLAERRRPRRRLVTAAEQQPGAR